MTDEILVNATPIETRVAIIENGLLQEVLIERTQRRGLVGNIYRGKVVRVLPGMQAAFIDIGLERTSFISVIDLQKKEGETPEISTLLHEGQMITVQIIKDPIGTKGARVTTFLSVSSRYLVYMPDMESVGISQRIVEEQERERLRDMIETYAKEIIPDLKGSLIVRTAAEGVSDEEIRRDMEFINRLWKRLDIQFNQSTLPVCIYTDLPLSLRLLRDLVRPQLEKIRVDSKSTLEKMRDFCDHFIPEVKDILERYDGDAPIFELYGVEADIDLALKRKVELKSGGYLIIDQTEAMTTIDVNTGSYVGLKNLEETVLKTNLEAANTLARQLRIRNLGGIIIVDFIDMKNEEYKEQVLKNLEKALAKDYTRTSISGVTELGLVQIVRKRTRESLQQVLCISCDVCHGAGTIKSIQTVCYEIFRAVLREARAYDHKGYMIIASQSVIDCLLDEESAHVAELEAFIGKTLQFQVELMYSPEHFEVILQ